jgi:hypothetical protein
VCGLDPFGSEQGPVEGSCGHGNETSGSIKYSESRYKFWQALTSQNGLHLISHYATRGHSTFELFYFIVCIATRLRA